jgi:hypothetical protein
MMGNKPFSRGRKKKEDAYRNSFVFVQTVIIFIIVIINQMLRILLFFCVTGLSALSYASAQQPVAAPTAEIPATSSAGAASLVAHNLSSKLNHTLSLAAPVNSQVRQPDRTKVIRIYSGAGFFDLLLAEKLRPGLSTGFASKSGIAKPTAAEIAAPAQVDGPKQIPVVSNL